MELKSGQSGSSQVIMNWAAGDSRERGGQSIISMESAAESITRA